MRPTVVALALTVVLSLFPAGARAAGEVEIVSAENIYGDLAQQIGGDHVKITSILSNPDQDPHLFESSPSTARAIAGAGIVIYNGVDYDPWMDKLLSAAINPDRTALVAADLIGKKSGDNPHVWYDPATLPALAKALAGELARRDPGHAADYQQNLDKFDASFATLTKAIEAIKAKYAGTPVTATEPVFGYMADALGFKMMNEEFQTALMNDTEPAPSQVARFEESLKDGSVKILFYNSQVTDETTERLLKLARDNKVAVVGVTETKPEGKTVQDWFGAQLHGIEQVLSGQTQ